MHPIGKNPEAYDALEGNIIGSIMVIKRCKYLNEMNKLAEL